MAEDRIKFVSPEEEIKELERKLQEKKMELAAGQGVEVEEKEVFREVLKSHVEEAKREEPELSGPAPAVSHVLTDDPRDQAQKAKQKEEREEKIKRLVEMAMTKSIKDAVKMAGKVSPYLLDELHDHLVDDYYDKLVSLRKIKKL